MIQGSSTLGNELKTGSFVLYENALKDIKDDPFLGSSPTGGDVIPP